MFHILLLLKKTGGIRVRVELIMSIKLLYQVVFHYLHLMNYHASYKVLNFLQNWTCVGHIYSVPRLKNFVT